MFTESIFFISFAGILGMLSFKWFEDKQGEIHWWSRLITRADAKVHEIIALLAQKYGLAKKVVSLFLFEFLPAYAYHQTVKFKDYIYKKYYASAGNLKGEKRMLRGSGSVSEFLQNIKKESDGLQSTDDSLQKDEEKLEK